MKTAAEVYMDFAEAQNLVSELRSIANETRRVAAEQLQQALMGIDGAWYGENSERFLAKGRTLQNDVKGTADSIDKIANAVASIAKSTRDAELRAIEIARTRSGGTGSGSGGGGASSW